MSILFTAKFNYFTYMWVPIKSTALLRDHAFSNITKQ